MTTQKKYELLQNDTINHNGRTLYRIKAICHFRRTAEYSARATHATAAECYGGIACTST
ncbi:TPA: hypothetical protein PXF07_002409 [Mannheimia haemolytica]|uniref:hypothetical protein n=1 Tax=Mannheimia haemolytica TaxID=75985 RepID=UPI0001594E55|nr:hypothetical protein [Mannheimia haemolytica]EDN75497.1 hypothetical protein MHA_2628 [Mannheimia haemolytica PHL213]MDQ6539008.1 hypothetical protein [Mannheimia haemolytica]MDW0363800.1 hypothetical protein [Mannheimia haemolytica]MDW0366845.1 hypothetical protein [Mannheimia haemolytica]MDW0369664.1 hypothetical protein [Mannheimia haemolytica]